MDLLVLIRMGKLQLEQVWWIEVRGLFEMPPGYPSGFYESRI